MRLIVGDCIDVMRDFAANSIDAIVTDPPYGLGFMGKEWDSPGGTGDFPMRRNDATNTVNTGVTRQGGRQRSCEDFAKRQLRDARAYQRQTEEWAREALRILKPGAHLIALGGSRTYHRLACGIEDAGFEKRDCIFTWLYGSGFPKSRNPCSCAPPDTPGEADAHGWTLCTRCGGQIELGTALKPACEPAVLARKPLMGTVAQNVAEHGTGALNIDGCRIHTEGSESKAYTVKRLKPGATLAKTGGSWRPESADALPWDEGREYEGITKAGRWPANVVFDEAAAAVLDEQSGHLESGNAGKEGHHRNQPPRENGGIYGGGKGLWKSPGPAGALYGDAGGASRFFYVAKADVAERNAGLAVTSLFAQDAPERNTHPTVKPIELMRWLCRLVTPPSGTVLDPFLGSGTTGIAADLEGFSFIGIEREPDYMRIAEARLSHWLAREVVAA